MKRLKSNAVTPTGVSRVESSHLQALIVFRIRTSGVRLEILKGTSVFENKIIKESNK